MSTRSAASSVICSFEATIFNTMDDGAVQSSGPIQVALAHAEIPDGADSGQANRFWSRYNRSLASGASETIDLYGFAGIDIGGGAGNDALGLPLTIEEAVTIIVKHESGAGQLETIPPAGNPFNALGGWGIGAGNALRAGGVRLWHEPGDSGLDLSATKRNITFQATGGAVNYSVYVLGRDDDDVSSSSSSLSSSSSSTSSKSSSSSTSSVSSFSTSSSSSLSSQSSSSSSSSSVSSSSSSSISSSSTSSISSSSTSTLSSSSTSSLSSSSSSSSISDLSSSSSSSKSSSSSSSPSSSSSSSPSSSSSSSSSKSSSSSSSPSSSSSSSSPSSSSSSSTSSASSSSTSSLSSSSSSSQSSSSSSSSSTSTSSSSSSLSSASSSSSSSKSSSSSSSKSSSSSSSASSQSGSSSSSSPSSSSSSSPSSQSSSSSSSTSSVSSASSSSSSSPSSSSSSSRSSSSSSSQSSSSSVSSSSSSSQSSSSSSSPSSSSSSSSLSSSSTSSSSSSSKSSSSSSSSSGGMLNGLISYWKMDEASGDAIDARGAHDLTADAGSGTGILNGDRVFDTGGQLLRTDAAFYDDTDGITIAGWVKLSDITTTANKVWSLKDSDGGGNTMVECNVPGNGSLQLHNGSTAVSIGSLSDDAWIFVAIWFKNLGNSGIYVNGAWNSVVQPSSFPLISPYKLTFNSSNSTTMEVDEFALWTRKLSIGDLDYLYGNGTPPGYGALH